MAQVSFKEDLAVENAVLGYTGEPSLNIDVYFA